MSHNYVFYTCLIKDRFCPQCWYNFKSYGRPWFFWSILCNSTNYTLCIQLSENYAMCILNYYLFIIFCAFNAFFKHMVYLISIIFPIKMYQSCIIFPMNLFTLPKHYKETIWTSLKSQTWTTTHKIVHHNYNYAK